MPTNFNGFEPENLNRKFNGKVSIEFALANSLNIPAVKVVKDLGKTTLIEQLKMADFWTVKKQEKDLGLSIVLGGCGVTLEEMTQLYAAFANDGNWQKCSFLNVMSPDDKRSGLSWANKYLKNMQIWNEPPRQNSTSSEFRHHSLNKRGEVSVSANPLQRTGEQLIFQ